MIQETSKLAYREVRELSLGNRQREVYLALKTMEYATNNMIAEFLAIPINSITPRIHELRQKGIVELSHVSWCPVKKTKCNYWKIVEFKELKGGQ